MKKGIRALETEIETIKRELLSLGDLRPGSLSKQYNVCGNPRCRCKEDPPRKHGPYLSTELHAKRKEWDPVHQETTRGDGQEASEELRSPPYSGGSLD
jgi:hypothetical protein